MPDTFRSLIDRSAREYPDRVYLIDPDANLTLTYRDLRHLCSDFDAQLHTLKLGNSSKLGFLLDNGYWTTVIFLGTMYCGHLTVPLNAVASKRNIAFAVQNAEVDLIFVSENYLPLMNEVFEVLGRKVEFIVVDAVNGVSVDAKDTDSKKLVEIVPESPAMILHTSGTVGLPKGAVLTHANLIAGGHNVILAHKLTEQDRAYCILPLYHINGQVVTCIAPLVNGSSVIMPKKFSVSRFWQHVEDYQCSWLSVVPTITKYLLDRAHSSDGNFDSSKISKLRFARSASSAMPAGMHRDFEKTFGVPMLETMGMTETAAPLLANPMPPAVRKVGSVGLAFGDEVIIIGDSEERLFGVVGEIVVRGSNVINEYYKNPEATRNSFTSDGWFRTGDLGYQDDDGYIFITGRIKELIIKGGENISPREIDDVLYHHEAVLEAGAFGFPDSTYGQTVAVAVVLKQGKQCSEGELIEFCRTELGNFRCPSKIFFKKNLPKGPSGKIQRLEIARSIIQEIG